MACRCGFWMSEGGEEFALRHLSQCDRVAPWIRIWALALRKKKDWRRRVGLV